MAMRIGSSVAVLDWCGVPHRRHSLFAGNGRTFAEKHEPCRPAASRLKARTNMHHKNDSQWEERYSLGPIIPGIILVALGALFLLNNLHIIQVREFFRYWPVILIALGLARLLDSGQAG